MNIVKKVRHYQAYFASDDIQIQLVADFFRENSQLELIAHLTKLKTTFDDLDLTDKKRLIIDEKQTDSSWLVVSRSGFDQYQSKLKDEIEQFKQELRILQKRLEAPGYVEGAPADLVEQTRDQIKDKQSLIEKLEKSQSELQ